MSSFAIKDVVQEVESNTTRMEVFAQSAMSERSRL